MILTGTDCATSASLVSTAAEVYGPPYLRPRHRRCFYCTALLVPATCFAPGTTLPPNAATFDHIFPRRLRPRCVSPEWHRLNKVPACWQCNNRKGDMPPALWAGIVPDTRRDAVTQRLARLEAGAAIIAA